MVREVRSNWPTAHPDHQAMHDFDEYDELLKVLNPQRDIKKSNEESKADQINDGQTTEVE